MYWSSQLHVYIQLLLYLPPELHVYVQSAIVPVSQNTCTRTLHYNLRIVPAFAITRVLTIMIVVASGVTRVHTIGDCTRIPKYTYTYTTLKSPPLTGCTKGSFGQLGIPTPAGAFTYITCKNKQQATCIQMKTSLPNHYCDYSGSVYCNRQSSSCTSADPMCSTMVRFLGPVGLGLRCHPGRSNHDILLLPECMALYQHKSGPVCGVTIINWEKEEGILAGLGTDLSHVTHL